MSDIITYDYAEDYFINTKISLYANGIKQTVFSTPSTDIAAFTVSGECAVTIEYETEITAAVVRPLSRGIKAVIKGRKVHIVLKKCGKILVDTEGQRQLHIYADRADDIPAGENVRVYRTGHIYDEGEIRLVSGEELYIEGGAVVRGRIIAEEAEDIRICGNGILDGSFFSDKRRLCVFRKCKNIRISGIIMVRPSLWMLMLHECVNVKIDNIKQVGEVVSSDGIDIVSSSHVDIGDCFLRNNDDCIAVKALETDGTAAADVEDVRVHDCVFLNDTSGNALEIGHELRCRKVSDIVFENCDILSVHGYGAAFAVHNADRAAVENITYADIRVEHYYDKLIDIRIINSMWGKSAERGYINNIHFRNIFVAASVYNPGYSVSLIGGHDDMHRVKNICFENFCINQRRMIDSDEMDLFIKQADGISYK